MVRIASLKDMVNAGYKKKDIAGMTPQEQLGALNEKTHAFCENSIRPIIVLFFLNFLKRG